MSLFRFSHSAIEASAETKRLQLPAAGGFASFEGWVRNLNEGRAVNSLTYEAFEQLAVLEGEKIVQEAITRFGVLAAQCVHRVGVCPLGDMAVWVGVSAVHRAEAFAACRYIIDEVKHRVPIWKKEFYTDGDSGWVNCERCAQPHGEQPHHHDHQHAHTQLKATAATTELLPDYSRQTALKAIGSAGQAKLKQAKVLIVGAGGLGVPAALYLAGAGVGVLAVMDHDVVERSNLHRQPIYTFADLGKNKALCLKSHLNALNPAVDVRAFSQRAEASLLPTLAADYDVLLDCSDNFATRYVVHDVARALSKPLVVASVYQYEGQIQTIVPAGACLRCVWPNAPREGLVGNCQEAGVLGPIPGVLGALQALETIKWIVGMHSPLTSQLALWDLMSYQTQTIHITRHPDCARAHQAHALTPAATEAELAQLNLSWHQWTALTAPKKLVIDIRSAEERAALALATPHQSHLAREILADPAPYRHAALLLVCATGRRSQALAEELQALGFTQAYSLTGGISSTKPLQKNPQA
jgi:sulfur-carrier protein adenylyltransferase/sulfurtransferase